MRIGIEAINAYVGQTVLDIRTLFEARQLDVSRFDNLMMQQKSVGLPCEDPVTNGVNAAKPLIEQLTEAEKNNIELVITATESGLDFGKSLGNYIHKYLNLPKHSRVFEMKQACYAGTAAVQMAAAIIASNVSPDAKALVISTDVARSAVKMTYAEPSQGVAAVAMLIGRQPDILELDIGANGFHSYEVMDTFRPDAEIETGDADLSLLSYLDCLEGSFQSYLERVEGADYATTFDYFAFHTPFAGMVKGAHQKMMRQFKHANLDEINEDFKKRVLPSLTYCMRVGNAYSASLYLALCGLIDNVQLKNSHRIGLYSYGSGCSSEFYSGIITPRSQEKLRAMKILEKINQRYMLSMDEYDHLLENTKMGFGIKNRTIDFTTFQSIFDKQFSQKGLLFLKDVKDYHREYGWS